MVLGSQESTEHRGLGLAEALRHHRPEDLEALAQLVHRHRRRGIQETAQRGEAAGLDTLLGEKHVDRRGW